MACVAKFSFYEKLLSATLVPIGTLIVILLTTPVRLAFTKSKKAHDAVTAFHSRSALLVIFVFCELLVCLRARDRCCLLTACF